MAWPNIEERRARVAALLAEGVAIYGPVRRQLTEEFKCSAGTIIADMIALRRGYLRLYVQPPMRERIYARDGRVCQYCGATDAKEFIIEHVIPAALGGEARPHNLTVACQSCNIKKGRRVWIPNNLDTITRDHPDWRARILEMADAR